MKNVSKNDDCVFILAPWIQEEPSNSTVGV